MIHHDALQLRFSTSNHAAHQANTHQIVVHHPHSRNTAEIHHDAHHGFAQFFRPTETSTTSDVVRIHQDVQRRKFARQARQLKRHRDRQFWVASSPSLPQGETPRFRTEPAVPTASGTVLSIWSVLGSPPFVSTKGTSIPTGSGTFSAGRMMPRTHGRCEPQAQLRQHSPPYAGSSGEPQMVQLCCPQRRRQRRGKGPINTFPDHVP